MTDTARPQAGSGVWLLVDRAPVFMSPVPGENPLTAENLGKSFVPPEFIALFLIAGKQLMVRKQDNFSISCLAENSFQPVDLLVVYRMICVGNVQADKCPILVLMNKIARILAKRGQSILEIVVSAGVHFVVRIQSAVRSPRPLWPKSKKALADFVFRASIIHVSKMHQHRERIRILANAFGDLKRTVKSGTPIPNDADARPICQRLRTALRGL